MKKICLFLLLALSVSSYAQSKKQPTEMEKNKKLLLVVVEELFNKGDTTVADKYFVPEFAKEEKVFTKLIRSAFPDLKIKVDRLVAENGEVAARWIATGTHQGTFLGVSPTNKSVSWKGSWFWTFKNGKITDGMGKGSWDALGLLKQLQSK
jgi:steroid delta-isomerase-like uncharacterized protein